MNDRPFTETEITVGVDGLPDHAPTPEKFSRAPRAKTAPAIPATRSALTRFDTAYRHGLHMLAEATKDPALRSPAGRQQVEYTHPSPFAKAPAPESRPPAGGDPQLRAALIRSAQLVAQAIRELMVWDWGMTAWHPWALSHIRCADCGSEAFWDCRLVRHSTFVSCDAEGRVVWRDPDCLTTRVLDADEVGQGVDQLRGLLGALEGQTLDEADSGIVTACLDAADKAVKQLKWVGVWAEPVRDEIRFCKRAGCVNPDTGLPRVMDGGGEVCATCRKRDQRAREKAS